MTAFGEQLSLGLFIFSVSLGIGGGLYKNPRGLSQLDARSRFHQNPEYQAEIVWTSRGGPPLLALRLACFHAAGVVQSLPCMAQQTCPLRTIWFGSGMVIVVKSIATYRSASSDNDEENRTSGEDGQEHPASDGTNMGCIEPAPSHSRVVCVDIGNLGTHSALEKMNKQRTADGKPT